MVVVVARCHGRRWVSSLVLTRFLFSLFSPSLVTGTFWWPRTWLAGAWTFPRWTW